MSNPNLPNLPPLDALLNDLISTTDELAGDGREVGLIRELAECEIAEHNAYLNGYMTSPESTNAARERAGEASSWELHQETLRVRAKVESARVHHSTLLALLAAYPTSPPHAPPAPL